MEDVAWNPPLLTFTVERHGGTLQGSTRAELQRWTVDVGQGKTTCESGGYRQLYGRQAPFDIEALAEDIVTLIVTRQPDDRLRWCADEKVLVLMGMVLPNQSAVKQTLTGRRKRLRAALKEHLAGKGWAEVKPNLWKRGGCVP